MGGPVDFDLWKTARKQADEMKKVLQKADQLNQGDPQRLLLLDDAASKARAYARQLENVALAERQGEERGVSFWNVSMFDNSAEPILVG